MGLMGIMHAAYAAKIMGIMHALDPSINKPPERPS
jgi:hypothetical protein